jgi:hypothetical protein
VAADESPSVNPYAAPRPEPAATPDDRAPRQPRRDWLIWAATFGVLGICFAGALVGGIALLAWLGPLSGLAKESSGARLLEPIGAGGVNLMLVAFAFGYAQIKAVFGYDAIWARTVAFAMFIGAAAMLLGAIVLAEATGSAGWILLPAVVALVLGFCMFDWSRKLRAARLAAPRIVPTRATPPAARGLRD